MGEWVQCPRSGRDDLRAWYRDFLSIAADLRPGAVRFCPELPLVPINASTAWSCILHCLGLRVRLRKFIEAVVL